MKKELKGTGFSKTEETTGLKTEIGLHPANTREQPEILHWEKKRVRCRELYLQKVIQACSNVLEESDFSDFSGPLSEMENRLLYFLLMDLLGSKRYSVSGEKTDREKRLWERACNLDDKQKNRILRDFISVNLQGTKASNERKELWIGWVGSFYPEKITEIILQEKETYLQRREKIDAEIARIKLTNFSRAAK